MAERIVTGPWRPDERPDRAGQRPRPLLRAMLGDALRQVRLDQGRTLADVARPARVSMPYLSEIERGRKEASSEVLAAICDALGIQLADLLAMTVGAAAPTSAAPLANRPASQPASEQADGTYAKVIRLGAIGDRAAPVQPTSPGDAVCLLAA